MPTPTGTTLITDALLLAGIGDQYNPPDGNTSDVCLRWLNDLLDLLSGRPVYVYQNTEGTVALPTGGANSVLLPSGVSITTRPAEILNVSIVDASNNTYALRIIDVNEWADIRFKPATGRPYVVYFDAGYPTITAWFYPTPMFAGDIAHFWYLQQLTQFANLNQTLSAPPGWSRAIKALLALNICAGFRVEPTSQLMQMGREARRVLGLGNTSAPLLPLPAVLSTGTRYNIYTDE